MIFLKQLVFTCSVLNNNNNNNLLYVLRLGIQLAQNLGVRLTILVKRHCCVQVNHKIIQGLELVSIQEIGGWILHPTSPHPLYHMDISR